MQMHVTRNAPSAGTERIDRIKKCHSGLCNSIVSQQDYFTLLQSALRLRSQFHNPVRCAPARDIMCTVRYGIVPTLRRDSENLR